MSSAPDAATVEARVVEAARRWDPTVTGAAVDHLDGGQSSLTYRAALTRRDGSPSIVVVKVAPAGLAPVRNRDVLRQARLLRTVHATRGFPVPEVLFDDPGDPPEVPPLFAMAYVAGDSVEPLFDRDAPAVPTAARAHHCAELLVDLQAIDPALAGDPDEVIADGRSEIDRWSGALATVDQDLVEGWADRADGLAAAIPEPLPPTLVHGDYRLGNMLADGDRVAAVIDWEIWSVGDPRLDLAWLRLNADPDVFGRTTPNGPAMPTPDALLDTYEHARGAALTSVGWFDALARFKAAAVWALLIKHARRRGDAGLEEMVPVLPRLLAAARPPR